MILIQNSISILLCWSWWSCGDATVVTDPSLLDSMRTDNNVFLTMVERPSTVLEKLEKLSFQDKFEKRTKCAAALKEFAAASQAPVVKFMTQLNMPFRSFWVSNQIFVPNCSSTFITVMQQRFPDNIKEIKREEIVELMPVIKDESAINADEIAPTEEVLWNLKAINADQAWAMGWTGKGCRVAVCDTGISSSHTCFENRVDDTCRRDGIAGIDNPVVADAHGHGTHCAGTIGGRGLGVAQNCTLMSCTCCQGKCTESAIKDCCEWVCLPNDDPHKGADVVSNSWGGAGGSRWLDDPINFWIFCGTFPVFANGNSGPSCKSAGSPADNKNVVGVGAVNNKSEMASFSSRGPSNIDNSVKPDVCAPGVNIMSASNANPFGTKTMSGTSMACPHVAGVAALMMGKNPNLSPTKVKSILINSCTKDVSTKGETCAYGVDSKFPNDHFGNGVVDCVNAIKMVSALEAQGVDNNINI